MKCWQRGIDWAVHYGRYLFSPRHAYAGLSRWEYRLRPVLPFLWGIGLVWALYIAPPDYQQRDAFRMIYVHVPCAFLSLFIYVWAAAFSGIHLVFGMKMAEWISVCSAYLGAVYTALALLTGAIWGKPMWGTWWVWDARLTSELILLFLYIGYIACYRAIPDTSQKGKIAGLLLVVGVVNVPIIHYSVQWWYTLHQGSTITRWGPSQMDPRMLYPLWWMLGVFFLTFFFQLAAAVKTAILYRERASGWVHALVAASSEKYHREPPGGRQSHG